MTRQVIALAGAFVAVVGLTLGSAEVEARQCRTHRRNQRCQQTSNCADQQTGNYQQTSNCGYQSSCQQTARCASTATACCTPQSTCCAPVSTCCSVQPVSGTVQPAYDTPASSGDSVPRAPIVTAPAPAPGA